MLQIVLSFFFLFGVARGSECVSRNHIILIHGIGGSSRTFGVMDKYLNKINNCNVAVNYIYDTGNSKLSTFDFATDFDQFIDRTLAKNKFQTNDKISLVMHSQGGIIGSLWLLNTRAKNPELYSKIDSFITLSTPFYGTKIASLGKRVLFSLAAKDNNPLSRMGKIELQEMSYGSSTILFLENNFSRIFENTHIRFLSVSGEKLVSHSFLGEGDTTVSPYSANPNHYSYQISKNGVEEQHGIGIVPFTSVIATHIPSGLPGIAHIGKACLVLPVCLHPSIDLIEAQLNGVKSVFKKRKFQKYRVHTYLWSADKNLSIEAEDEHGAVWKLRPAQNSEASLMSDSFFGRAADSQEKVVTLRLLRGKTVIRIDRIRVRGGLSTFVTYEL